MEKKREGESKGKKGSGMNETGREGRNKWKRRRRQEGENQIIRRRDEKNKGKRIDKTDEN